MATRSKPTTAEAEGKRILDSIRLLVRSLRLFDREAQAKYGISAAQMFVLHALDTDDVLSLNEVAEKTATDQSSASVVVGRLVEVGYVSRTARKDDRRHVELRLTAKGRAVIRRSPPPAQQKILGAIAAMPPRDRKAFAEMLDSFVETIGAGGRKAPMLFEESAPKSRKRT
jgi:MarR family transcriptional regulator, organic hydroperoxide resistance regulator